MKIIKSFKLFENIDHLSDDIEDVFMYFIDHYKVKIKGNEISFPFHNYDISWDYKISKFGKEYRPIENGDRIIEELVYSLDKLNFLGLKISYAKITWVNAGEWSKMIGNEEKGGTGPGNIDKYFTEKGFKEADLEVIEKKQYHVDLITDFLKEKGDRLRFFKFYLVK
jgi:hypothetical protein